MTSDAPKTSTSTSTTSTASPPAPLFPDRSRPSPSPAPSRAASPVTSVASSLASLRPFSDVPPTPLSKDVDLTPLPWRTCFDDSLDLPLPERGTGTWRIYSAGMTLRPRSDKPSAIPSTIVVLLHGAGHGALVWGIVATQLKSHVPVIAFDARGHGTTTTTPPSSNEEHVDDDTRLDVDTQVSDARALLHTLFKRLWPTDSHVPGVVLCGHSMGGAIAAKLAKTYNLAPDNNDNNNDNENPVQVRGLIVVDVVEGTAIAALPQMPAVLASRTRSFSTLERAIRYVVKSGLVRNVESARLSVPAQLRFDNVRRCWTWRTNLERTQPFWHGWFNGLSDTFVSAPIPKLLILANVNRLDKPLMIAQMQGKFQNIVITAAGHAIHEDQPEQTAAAIFEFLERNVLLGHADDDYEDLEEGDEEMVDTSSFLRSKPAVFQQRTPVRPHR